MAESWNSCVHTKMISCKNVAWLVIVGVIKNMMGK
jgi:hypothetical protein